MKPVRLLFFDVDGTLFGEATIDAIEPSLLASFASTAKKLRNEGWAVGLNSDTPLSYLKLAASRLGLEADCPILAELGAIYHSDGVSKRMGGVDDPAHWCSLVRECLSGIASVDEVPEGVFSIVYGGIPAKNLTESGKWGLGIGREASVSVFAPAELIEKLETELCHAVENSGQDLEIHANPSSCFFSINRKLAPPLGLDANKGKSLATIEEQIRREGKAPEVVMIGNSLADYTDNELFGSFIKTIIIPDGRTLPAEVEKRLFYRASKPLLLGCIEAMEFLLSS